MNDSHSGGAVEATARGYLSNVFLTQKDAAALLHLSERTLERHRLTGTGPRFVKAGKRVLYRPADIDMWLAANTFGSTSEAGRAA